jgi:hypothetical protein
MQNPNLWNKLHLYGQKISIIVLLLLLVQTASAQNTAKMARENLPDYDERPLTYGFSLGLHASALRPRFSQAFTSSAYDSVANIVPQNSAGFSIGFLTSFRLFQYLDLQFMPKVAFYDYSMSYRYTQAGLAAQDGFADFTVVDFPLLLKYKSQRRGNYRMFVLGGVTPTLDVTGKKQKSRNREEGGLRLKGDNLSLEAGVGTDIYFEFFRFSPQIRYAYGLTDVLDNKDNAYGRAFDRINTHSVALYLVFN